ncbi:hypothetical protein HFO56_00350 [Rhizobium laguerreae]|uniref:hypothetical protein n=1 Tax=Rhizobium laguerreae TaxID=1076926 RepID=UPI001C914852|nr:hypothetical protein [Rhizobium laguerreae]MBY3150878.1 hypothetical protein [Rhizobium laguerreae]
MQRDIKSSHCAEAVARGFQFNTNAAMIAELKDKGLFERKPDRTMFEGFLAERGYDPVSLQVSLFTDAVRLATQSKWKPLANPDQIRVPICICCSDIFGSTGSNNRTCGACKIRDGRTIGFNHRDGTRKRILTKAFLNGKKPEDWRYLNVRPGWADFLASRELKSQVRTLIAHRERASSGDFSDMPDLVIDLFASSSFLDVMDELEVPRKRAKTWWHSGKADPLGDCTSLTAPTGLYFRRG